MSRWFEQEGDKVRRRSNVTDGENPYHRDQDLLIGDDATGAAASATRRLSLWQLGFMILTLLVASAALGVAIWNAIDRVNRTETIDERIEEIRNMTLPVIQAIINEALENQAMIKDCLGVIKNTSLPSIQEAVDFIRNTQLPSIDACVAQIKNVVLPQIKACADEILVGVNQLKDTDIPALSSLTNGISVSLNAFIFSQQAMIDDPRCDDGNPCTVDIYQFEGCMHKTRRCLVEIEKRGNGNMSCTPVPCQDYCHAEPIDEKRKISPVQGIRLVPKNGVYNGECGISGNCVPTTACKGQCTPLTKRDGKYSPTLNRARGMVALRNTSIGCPVLPFKPEAEAECKCRKEGACLYTTRFDLGFYPGGTEPNICDNQAYLQQVCMSSFTPLFGSKADEEIVKCLRVQAMCEPLVKKKRDTAETGVVDIHKRMGDNKLRCQFHFACAALDGELDPIVKKK